ncbi:MAG: hypothetical protein HF978_21710 [Desulfobacteraceae bacterium]|nr:hypothetical protein [Desulfobacteraceae bacterium]MBC2758164.1 hypothetical protein [Desulfobacteraceae bacterium]
MQLIINVWENRKVKLNLFKILQPQVASQKEKKRNKFLVEQLNDEGKQELKKLAEKCGAKIAILFLPYGAIIGFVIYPSDYSFYIKAIAAIFLFIICFIFYYLLILKPFRKECSSLLKDFKK